MNEAIIVAYKYKHDNPKKIQNLIHISLFD
jgi:hypothetical protein